MIRRLISLGLGAIAATAGGWLGWLLVRRDLHEWEAGAYTAGPEMVIVVMLAVVCGVVATFVAWRILVGPPIEHAEWTLLVPAAPAGAPPAAPPRIADLIFHIERLGYVIDVSTVDDAALPTGPAAPQAALPGASLEIVDRGIGERGARVVARVPHARDDGGESLGFIDAYGRLDGPHEELARFVIATLGDVLPGVAFKRMDSALEAEPASAIRGELPARPRHLPAKRAQPPK